ncbi:hypothetical protein PIROE2DRAFT_15664 [Piromyces sp. E2]|nr:hypothetical protein PIROE2DRAFT_15664 [Piromyces sp. E2]|eukprot:OUM58953.1 hypothetical protein PIROE2DRAFT_15664 [Piromyces sp. E2]
MNCKAVHSKHLCSALSICSSLQTTNQKKKERETILKSTSRKPKKIDLSSVFKITTNTNTNDPDNFQD